VGIGHALIYLGQPEEARKAFIRLRFIARNAGEKRQASLWLAASYLFLGEHDSAIREIEQRLEEAREAGDTASQSADVELIGELLLDGGRAGDARRRFDEGMELLERADVPEAIKETGRVDYLFDMARVELAGGNLAAAAETTERYALRIASRDVPEERRLVHLLRGLIALARKDAKGAMGELSQANPRNPRVLLALAQAQAAAGETEAALATCRAALVFNTPDLSNAFVYRPANELLAVLTAQVPPTPSA